jgi:hypothetical protein
MAQQYIYLKDVEDIAEKVIPKMGWKEKPNIKFLILVADNCSYQGKCSKASGKWKYLTDFDYVVEIWQTFWDSADEAAKKALLFHELLHIQPIEKKDGSTTWGIRLHDVEEFFDVIEEYGAWDHSLKVFEESLEHHRKKK